MKLLRFQFLIRQNTGKIYELKIENCDIFNNIVQFSEDWDKLN